MTTSKSLTYLSGLLLLPNLFTMPVSSTKFGDAELMYEWSSVELDWPSDEVKNESIRNGSFVPERNLITGIKIYEEDIYVTIPRWKWNSGQPATLLKVVSGNRGPKLRPYPNWQAQQLGNCEALQFVQSMEIDPNTGLMYALDTGRTGFRGKEIPNNLCPAKVVVIDLKNNSIVDVYEFPESVVSSTKNFINDIVLDYVNGSARFAYITDTFLGRMYCLDLQTRSSYMIEDESMKPEGGNGTIINVNGVDYTYNIGINGIAMSCDFNFLYYTTLGGYNLYQIPTSKLRNVGKSPLVQHDFRLVGRKVSQSDGMVYSHKRLYFVALRRNAVYYWDIQTDEKDQGVEEGHIQMRTQTQLVKNDTTMQWADTLAIDQHGWLWFVSNRIPIFDSGSMDFSGADGSNMHIGRVFINETSYLDCAKMRRADNNNGNMQDGDTGNRKATSICINTFALVISWLLVSFLWY